MVPVLAELLDPQHIKAVKNVNNVLQVNSTIHGALLFIVHCSIYSTLLFKYIIVL